MFSDVPGVDKPSNGNGREKTFRGPLKERKKFSSEKYYVGKSIGLRKFYIWNKLEGVPFKSLFWNTNDSIAK